MFLHNLFVLFLFLQTAVKATDQRTDDTNGDANPAVPALDVHSLQTFIENSLAIKFQTLENNVFNRIQDVIFSESAHNLQTAQQNQITINSRLDALETILQTSFQQEIVSKINQQQEILGNLTEIELRNENQLHSIYAILAKISSREKCEMKPDTSTDSTTIANNNTNNAAQPDADPSASRLLHVTVPSSVRARTDVWKDRGIPDKDDLDLYMVNVTGCQYMARGFYPLSSQSVSNSTARGTWRRRRRLAVRGDWHAWIRVTWGAGHDYRFRIGDNSNTQTVVYDYIQHKTLLQRATPGVMSRDKYTQFLYIQLGDGVMSFGALGESTPWLRHDVTVSAGDVVRMEYDTGSHYGVKLLVCE